MSALPQPAWTAPLITGTLAALERGWKQLQQAAAGNPFLSWEWQHAWAAELPFSAVAIAQPFADGTLAGLLALQRRRRHGLVQLEFLGQGSGGDELDCLLHPQAPLETASRLLGAARTLPGWHLLRLEAADAGGRLAQGWSPGQVEPDEWLPTLTLPSSFEALLASHSANFRSEVRRRRRRLAAALPLATVECATTPASVGAGLEHLFRLHNLRRAQKDGAGIYLNPRLCAFHRRAAVGLAARGVARLYLLRTPTAVLAALYGLEAGSAGERRFLYFQSGFDPAVSALSPGTVLLSAVIEDCITRGLRRFDFLRGTEGYKARWTSERRASLRLLDARAWAGAGWMRLRRGRRRLQGLRGQPG